MFTLDLGYYTNYHLDFSNLNGALQLASANYSHRHVENATLQRLFFDPQLYLSGLNVSTCSDTCAKLSTYPWFQVPNIPKRDQYKKIKEWTDAISALIGNNWSGNAPTNIEQSVRDAINFQVEKGCTHIILPSPLVVQREDECAVQAAWLDSGIEVAQEIEPNQPFLATVALDESVLDSSSFASNGYLDTLLDQYTSRNGVNGVYIVVNQTYSRHPYDTSKNTLKAYLHLVKGFSRAGYEHIVVNFADIFGIVCLAFGATTFVTGRSQTLRRLAMVSMTDEGGGLPLPYYYSHKTVSEYLSEEEIKKVSSRGLYRRICDDTPFSSPLTDAINSGGDASQVPAWAESQNNVTASNKHFVEKLIREGISLQGSGADLEEVKVWLEDAEMKQAFLKLKISNDFPGRSARVRDWLDLIEIYEKNT